MQDNWGGEDDRAHAPAGGERREGRARACAWVGGGEVVGRRGAGGRGLEKSACVSACVAVAAGRPFARPYSATRLAGQLPPPTLTNAPTHTHARAGGGYAPPFRLSRNANAYCLVYVREGEWDSVMCGVGREDLSDHVRARLEVSWWPTRSALPWHGWEGGRGGG